jgi:hypothetical protein
VRVTAIFVLTARVVTANVALVAPAGIVTLGGTLASALLVDNDTTAPPFGAGAVSVTVPVVLFPPRIVEGLDVTVVNVAADVPACGVRVRTTE